MTDFLAAIDSVTGVLAAWPLSWTAKLGLAAPLDVLIAAALAFAATGTAWSVGRRLLHRLAMTIRFAGERRLGSSLSRREVPRRVSTHFTAHRMLLAAAVPSTALTRIVVWTWPLITLWGGWQVGGFLAPLVSVWVTSPPSLADVASVVTLILVAVALATAGIIGRARDGVRMQRTRSALAVRAATGRRADELQYGITRCLEELTHTTIDALDEALRRAGHTEQVSISPSRGVEIRSGAPSALWLRRNVHLPSPRWRALFAECELLLDTLRVELSRAADVGALGVVLSSAPAASRGFLRGLTPVPGIVRAAVERSETLLPLEARAIDPQMITSLYESQEPGNLVEHLREASSKEARETHLRNAFQRVAEASAEAIWYSWSVRRYARTTSRAVDGAALQRLLPPLAAARP
ncbi:hypothetical protein [Microbacterium sp.]|uniref:hypothetical protein n=1 Tax=Microbacterium sp. TaxID=51671 RepID=UPI0039E5B877